MSTPDPMPTLHIESPRLVESPSSRRVLLMVGLLLAQGVVEPALTSYATSTAAMEALRAETADDLHRMGLVDGIKGGARAGMNGFCWLAERMTSCETAAAVTGGALAFGACALIAGATVGAGAIPCFASLAVAQGIGMGAAQISSKACTDGSFVEECLTAPWAGVKRAVRDVRNDDMSTMTLVAPLIDVGTTAIPLYGVGAIAGKTGARVAAKGTTATAGVYEKAAVLATSKGAPRVGEAAKGISTVFDHATSSLQHAAREGGWWRSVKNAVSGGDKQALAKALSARGGQLSELSAVSRAYRTAGGTGGRAAQAAHGVGGKTLSKASALVASPGRAGKAARGTIALGKTGRPLLEGANSRVPEVPPHLVVPPTQGPRVINDMDPTLQPPGPPDGDPTPPPPTPSDPPPPSTPPATPESLSISFVSPGPHEAFYLVASDEEVHVSAVVRSGAGVRLWTAWLNGHSLGVGERLQEPMTALRIDITLNTAEARLPPGKYEFVVKASDARDHQEAALRFGVLDESGRLPEEWPGAGRTDCGDINHNGTPDCMEVVTSRVDPRPGQKNHVGALVGLVVLLAVFATLAWVFWRR